MSVPSMKLNLVIMFALVAFVSTAPQKFSFRPRHQPRQQFRQQSNQQFHQPPRQQISNVNAQVNNSNQFGPGDLAFSGGLVLASSQQVKAFGQGVSVDQAHAISQNIVIPGSRPAQLQFGRK